tara:strand:- start:52167 stop:52394 length:228 start_codon:yes stop_codon:yes gene_type:complete
MEKNYNKMPKSLNQGQKSNYTKQRVNAKDFNDVIIYKTNTAYSKIWIWLKVYAIHIGLALFFIALCFTAMLFKIF